ncbi:hypothetical protein SAMN04487895_11471 [Paenibacillus sophorae]|nr:hypothetical protein SAMN04487895_11471 [Paenibacillus sophorae]
MLPIDIPFTKQDIVDAVSQGDDSFDNSVVLTLDGKVLVVTLDEAQTNPDNYAVRHETFDSGDDYIGLEASKDEKLIELIYNNLCIGWEKHKKLGRTSVSADGV